MIWKRRDAELDEEVRIHLEMAARDRIGRGEDPYEARAAARRELGNVLLIKEVTRETWGGLWWERLLQDARYAVRSLRRTPAFTIAAVVALGLGVGSATAVFSVLEGVVLRPLPYAEPERLVQLWDVNRPKHLDHDLMSPVSFLDYRKVDRVVQDAAAWWRPQVSLTDDAAAEALRVPTVETTLNLFSVLGVRPQIGSAFAAEGRLFSHSPQILISDRLWRARFGGAPSIIGKLVRLNGDAYPIVSVMPAGFSYPAGTDVWWGLQWDPSQHSRGAHFMEGVARLAPGVSLDRANAALAGVGARLSRDFPTTNADWSVRAVALRDDVTGAFRPGLIALFGASSLLLLIACINVANLLLARSRARHGEIALRAALGASRTRLVRLFLTESLILSTAGSLAGVSIAYAGVHAMLHWSPIDIPRASEVGVDGPVLVFAIVVGTLTAAIFGLAPALAATAGSADASLDGALRRGAEAMTIGGRGSRGSLVIAEVALAVMLLSGAGLLLKSVERLVREDVGVDARGVTTALVQLPDATYNFPRATQFYTTLLAALRGRADVDAAGISTFLPLDPGWRLQYLDAAAPAPEKGAEPIAQMHSVDDGYFAALKVPILRGRSFDAGDDAHAPGVAVVSAALAQTRWPGENPIGKHLTITTRQVGPLGRRVVTDDDHQVIGVAADVKNASLTAAAEPAIYFSYRQFPYRRMIVYVRGRGDARALGTAVRDEVRRLEPSLALGDVKPLDRVLGVSIDPSRFIMATLATFAGLALALAAVGIFGVLSYAVSRRRREFAIRLALGAKPRGIVGLIVRQGVRLAMLGCVLGAVGAVISGRLLSNLLYETSVADPGTLGAVAGVVLLVAGVACFIPGWRAATEDPVVALRAE